MGARIRWGHAGCAALILAAVFAVGCRTVWVHPEATAEKYQKDTFFCKYGIEQSDWSPPVEAETAGEGSTADMKTEAERMTEEAGERSWALGIDPGRPVKRDWKKCMSRLGWNSVTSARQERAFRTTMIPEGGVGKQGRR